MCCILDSKERVSERGVNIIGFLPGLEQKAPLVFYSAAVFLIEQWYNYLWHPGAARCRAAETAPMLLGLTGWIKMRGGRLLARCLVCKHNYSVGAQRLEISSWGRRAHLDKHGIGIVKLRNDNNCVTQIWASMYAIGRRSMLWSCKITLASLSKGPSHRCNYG